MDPNNPISVIEELIQTCKDGQKGYLEAATHVKRSDLKAFFNEQSLERSRFAGELEAELIRLGKPLPENVAQIVRRQVASVQAAHDKVKSLRDAAERAAA